MSTRHKALKINLGIIGCSGAAHILHIKQLKNINYAQVVAVCDIDDGRGKAFQRVHGIPSLYNNYQDVAKRDDIDAIIVATPTVNHFESALAAIKSGKHVLVQKPLTMTLREADLLIAEAEKRKIKLYAYLPQRAMNHFIRTKELIEQGVVGDIYDVRIEFAIYEPRLRGSVEGFKTGTFVFTDWRKDPAQGGGALLDGGIHWVDLMRWFIGEVDSVFAMWNKPGKVIREYDSDDCAEIMLRFKNGAIGTIKSCFCQDIGPVEPFQIYGSGGVITPTGPRGLYYTYKDRKWENPDLGSNLYEIEPPTKQFIDWIIGKENKLYNTIEDARSALEIIMAAKISCETGELIKLPLRGEY